MSVSALAKLTRAIQELERAIGKGSGLSGIDRLALKSELEAHIQRIDELRQRL